MKWPNLLPREEKFHGFLESQATQAYECAKQLRLFIETANIHKAGDEIDKIRSTSKTLASEITSELHRSFITPFDREDIQDFSDLMYKVPKIIHKVKDRIVLHGLVIRGGCFVKQIDLIVSEAEVMQDLVKSLVTGKGSKGVIEGVDRLRDLEQKGDDIHNEILSVLFKSENDIRDIVLRRDIADMLESIVDRFRDAAGVALQIVLKHS